MKRLLHISKHEVHNQASKLFTPVKYGENGVVLCYPTCKIDYNLSCFLSNTNTLRKYLGSFYRRYTFIKIILDEEDTADTFLEKAKEKVGDTIHKTHIHSLRQLCKKLIDTCHEPYFFILNCQVVQNNVLNQITHLIHSQILEFNKVGALLFFEQNIQSPKRSDMLQRYNKFLQNIIYLPVYSNIESEKFLDNLSSFWNIKLQQKTRKKILDQFGGYLWFMREAVRQIRENNKIPIDEIQNSSGIKLRLQTLYNTLTLEEKDTISNLCFGKSSKISTDIKQHLIKTGLVIQKGFKYVPSLPLLASYIKEQSFSLQLRLSKNNQIFFQDKNITHVLLNKEAEILIFLLKHRGKTIDREQIARLLWGQDSEEKYSDWAVDKSISRLRNTLQELGISKQLIITKKSKVL